MKSAVIFILIVGSVSVLADPVLKQVFSDNDLFTQSEIKDDELPNISEPEIEPEDSSGFVNDKNDDTKYDNEQVNVVIEDDIVDPHKELLPPPQSDINIDYSFPVADDSYRYTPVSKIQDEIMETAAGFVPLTIFRRRQNPRRRFAIRRNFKKNPYRKFHLFYPNYAYYYGPSSLRFY